VQILDGNGDNMMAWAMGWRWEQIYGNGVGEWRQNSLLAVSVSHNVGYTIHASSI